MASITVERKVNLPIQTVWNSLGKFSETPGPEVEIIINDLGDSENHHIGMIRTITIGLLHLEEQLVASNPPHEFSYKVLGGAPMENYLGTVRFTSEGDSTLVNWHAEFEPTIPLTGAILSKVAQGSVNTLIDVMLKHHHP